VGDTTVYIEVKGCILPERETIGVLKNYDMIGYKASLMFFQPKIKHGLFLRLNALKA
jgi:hypothetical protein